MEARAPTTPWASSSAKLPTTQDGWHAAASTPDAPQAPAQLADRGGGRGACGRSASAYVSAGTPWPCSTAHVAPTRHIPNNEGSRKLGRPPQFSLSPTQKKRRTTLWIGDVSAAFFGRLAAPSGRANTALMVAAHYTTRSRARQVSRVKRETLDSRGGAYVRCAGRGHRTGHHEPPSICLFRPSSKGHGTCVMLCPGLRGTPGQSIWKQGAPWPWVYGGCRSGCIALSGDALAGGRLLPQPPPAPRPTRGRGRRRPTLRPLPLKQLLTDTQACATLSLEAYRKIGEGFMIAGSWALHFLRRGFRQLNFSRR